MSTHRLRVICISLAPALAWASLAAPELANAADDQLQEIVVTSTKREQSLQEVPMSVTALSSVTIEDAGIREFADYAAKIPNLTYSSGFGVIAGRSIAIRGVQGANTTGFYIDDMPVPSTLDPRVLDIDRIEVLRGPQGTLYGARSMGGTVRLITSAPDLNDFSGKVHALGSKVDEGTRGYQVDATLNVPLISDTLGVRLNAFLGNDGAFINRVHPSSADPALTVSSLTARSNFSGASLALLWKPLDNLTIRPFVMTQTTTLNGWPLSDIFAGSMVQNRTFDIAEPAADHWTYGGLTVNWALPLGDITSATGYFDRNAYEVEDVSEFTDNAFGVTGVPSPIWSGQSVHTFVEEARFNSKFPGPVQMIAGLYYTRTRTRNPQIQYAPGIDAAFGGALGTELVYEAAVPGSDDEIAAFGEVSYNFAPGWTATLGARESHIKTSEFIDWSGLAVDGVPQGGGDHKENSFTPKFSLKYDLNDDINFYASAAKGFRPGNGQAAPPPTFCADDYASTGLTPEELSKYNSDSLWSYELGTKTRWLDRRLTVNGAAYQINWTKLQQQSRLSCGFTFLVNAGSARSRGGEIEVEALPLTGLQVSLGVGYEDAVITGSSPQLRTQVGSPVQQIAPWTASSSVQYTHPLPFGTEWEALGRIDYSYTDHSFSANEDPENPRLRKSYQLTNLRTGIRNKRFQAAAYVSNLFNVHANLGDNASEAGEDPGRPRILINPPRTFGLEGTYRF